MEGKPGTSTHPTMMVRLATERSVNVPVFDILRLTMRFPGG